MTGNFSTPCLFLRNKKCRFSRSPRTHIYSRTASPRLPNDIIRRALSRIHVQSVLEPLGLVRDDGKRPDDLTLIAWQMGRPLYLGCHLSGYPSTILWSSIFGQSRLNSRTGWDSKTSQILRPLNRLHICGLPCRNFGSVKSERVQTFRTKKNEITY